MLKNEATIEITRPISTIVVATQSVSESREVALSAEELIFFERIL